MTKSAVDQATKKYWDTYFKDYGKMWTRSIPRRIKAAIKNVRGLGVRSIEGNVIPLAQNVTDGFMSLEAAFSGKVNGNDAKFLITAEFNSDGRMLKFEHNQIV